MGNGFRPATYKNLRVSANVMLRTISKARKLFGR